MCIRSQRIHVSICIINSCHPNYVKKAIPYGQALRIRRICNSEEKFENRLNDLKSHLVRRGFRNDLVENQLSKAKGIKREDLFNRDKNRSDKKDVGIPLTVDFYPALSGIGNIVELLWPILHVSDDMREIFGEVPRVAFRRSKDLRDEIVRSKLGKEGNICKDRKKCGKSRCKICDFVEKGDGFDVIYHTRGMFHQISKHREVS